MLNTYENKKYEIKCNKCGSTFRYSWENCLVKVKLDDKGNIVVIRSNFVECPNCSEEYDFGYESEKKNKVKNNNRKNNRRDISR